MRDDCAALPQRLWSWTEVDGELLPAWLTEKDWPWLRELLEETRACAGLPLRALEQRWRDDAGDIRAGKRLGMARFVLRRLVLACADRPSMPAELRGTLFAAVAAGEPPEAALQQAAARLGCSPAQVQAELLADLPGERRLRPPARALNPPSLALLVNRALAQGLLRTAESATLSLHGAARAVLRTAWLQGGPLEVEAAAFPDAVLRWRAAGSGTPARRRAALATILPVLPWCRGFELRAQCRLGSRRATLVLGSTDPILPGPEPRRFDSALERRFALEFARRAPGWRLVREPAPVLVGTSLSFPDFELVRERDGARALLEIAGLRREGALCGKLELLAAVPGLLLCLPKRLVGGELAHHPRVIPFARSVDAEIVVNRLEALVAAARSP